MAVQFTDNSARVMEEMNDAIAAYLLEAGATMQRQAANNTRIGTGETAGAWDYAVDESKGEVTIGNPLENAIWEEFGTGEYALHGNGRRGGWIYKDEKTGEYHHTYGKPPNRALHNAFITKKSALISQAEEVLKARMNN